MKFQKKNIERFELLFEKNSERQQKWNTIVAVILIISIIPTKGKKENLQHVLLNCMHHKWKNAIEFLSHTFGHQQVKKKKLSMNERRIVIDIHNNIETYDNQEVYFSSLSINFNKII